MVPGDHLELDDVDVLNLSIPIFVLAAPDVEGCTAAVRIEKAITGEFVWGVKLFGTGLGGAAKITVKVRAGFSAARGEVKEVFVPVSVNAEKGVLRRRGKSIGPAVRVDADNLRPLGAVAPRLLPRETAFTLGALVERYPLAGDTTGALAEYEYLYERIAAGETEIGVKAFGVDLSLKASVERARSMTVNYQLAGGFDYELHGLGAGDGLVWA